ncbi:hypothetical protein KKA69_02435 [Patescibacteria group bacterium]|nr:hypothetical protein [Patescibacteria group bacterium]
MSKTQRIVFVIVGLIALGGFVMAILGTIHNDTLWAGLPGLAWMILGCAIMAVAGIGAAVAGRFLPNS